VPPLPPVKPEPPPRRQPPSAPPPAKPGTEITSLRFHDARAALHPSMFTDLSLGTRTHCHGRCHSSRSTLLHRLSLCPPPTNLCTPSYRSCRTSFPSAKPSPSVRTHQSDHHGHRLDPAKDYIALIQKVLGSFLQK
jgi:hypothetical protein